jgi:hypothetical protein
VKPFFTSVAAGFEGLDRVGHEILRIRMDLRAFSHEVPSASAASSAAKTASSAVRTPDVLGRIGMPLRIERGKDAVVGRAEAHALDGHRHHLGAGSVEHGAGAARRKRTCPCP